MTTVSRDPADPANYRKYGEATVYTVRSTDLRRPEAFIDFDDAIRFCRRLGLPYTVR